MTQSTGRGRHIAVAAASGVALLGVILGSVAMASQGSDDGKSGRAAADAPTAKVPRERGKAAEPDAGGPVSEEISHDSESPGKVVNLTIDDGPDPVWTPKVLDLLRRSNVKATFCMIGPRAKEYPSLVKKVVADGHRLCDHSMDHNTAMDKRPESYQASQILDAQKLIEEAAGDGTKVRYYRAPRRRLHPLQPQGGGGPRHAPARLAGGQPRLAAPGDGPHRGQRQAGGGRRPHDPLPRRGRRPQPVAGRDGRNASLAEAAGIRLQFPEDLNPRARRTPESFRRLQAAAPPSPACAPCVRTSAYAKGPFRSESERAFTVRSAGFEPATS
ncbi:hypothetical protein GCM10020221_02220 [Streptomyces thioluteus]|uniref:NodB homology domain-containing protein n=1 Tax=Streptomyces thioluteus TaxID=66431 RepID=A0ABN3WD49_STRTU